jgi:hypothetical protein
MRDKHNTAINDFSVNNSGIHNESFTSDQSNWTHTPRRVTDAAFGLCFIVFMIGVFGIGVYGFAKGNPLVIVARVNGFGALCGTGVYKDTKFLYYPLNPGPAGGYNQDNTICVS